MATDSKHKIVNKIGNLGGPVLFAIFIVFLLITGGFGAIFNFAKDYAQFLKMLVMGCVVFAAIFGSVMLVFELTDRKFGNNAAVIIMFIYVIIGLPLIVLLSKVFS